MSTAPPSSALEKTLRDVVAMVQDRDVQAALIGRCALALHGLPCRYDEVVLTVSAAIAPPQGADSMWPGAWRQPLQHGLAVRCVSRSDPYESLYRSAIEEATRIKGVPLPVAPVATVCAVLMAERGTADKATLIDLIATGAIDIDSLRRVVREQLGVYALDDFEAIVQEAEWRAMRQRYQSGEETH